MIADGVCLDCCEYHFSVRDAVGERIKDGGKEQYPDRGSIYVDVTCPECDRRQGLVLDTFPDAFTIWPCSWNDEPCMDEDCPYCHGEYV